MAEISNNIITNKEILKDTIKEIDDDKTAINKLQKQITFLRIELEIIKIDYPKIVCTNISC